MRRLGGSVVECGPVSLYRVDFMAFRCAATIDRPYIRGAASRDWHSLRHRFPEFWIVAEKDAPATPLKRLKPVERSKHCLAVVRITRQPPLAQRSAEIAGVRRQQRLAAVETQP